MTWICANATAQPCRHTKSEEFPTLKGLCDVYIDIYAAYAVLNLECWKCARMR